jgi:hypothetical protein
MCHVSFLLPNLRLFIWVLIASGRDHAVVTNSFLLLLMGFGAARAALDVPNARAIGRQINAQ